MNRRGFIEASLGGAGLMVLNSRRIFSWGRQKEDEVLTLPLRTKVYKIYEGDLIKQSDFPIWKEGMNRADRDFVVFPKSMHDSLANENHDREAVLVHLMKTIPPPREMTPCKDGERGEDCQVQGKKPKP